MKKENRNWSRPRISVKNITKENVFLIKTPKLPPIQLKNAKDSNRNMISKERNRDINAINSTSKYDIVKAIYQPKPSKISFKDCFKNQKAIKPFQSQDQEENKTSIHRPMKTINLNPSLDKNDHDKDNELHDNCITYNTIQINKSRKVDLTPIKIKE